MGFKLLIRLFLFSFGLSPLYAVADIERLSANSEPFSTEERNRIGQFICGKSGFDLTDDGLRCRSCPSYTGQPDDSDGLYIDSLIRGHFTNPASDEIMLDTSGCEAHYAHFGGAILLREQSDKNTPGATLSSQVTPPELLYYLPGYRLNDCLKFDKPGQRSLLACNEYWMGQGEVIGHLSVFEVSSRTITRWRLFRWYDNSASIADHVISVVPEKMTNISSKKSKKEILQVKLSIVDMPRAIYDKQPDIERKTMKLTFIREGQRFFSDVATRDLLTEINVLTRVLDD